jgi:hypothetical protein
MGCFFAVEDGLLRLDSGNLRINRAVYPDLKNVTTDTVASQMTTLIRAHLAPELKQRNQSRSIRVSLNTALAMHPDRLQKNREMQVVSSQDTIQICIQE